MREAKQQKMEARKQNSLRNLKGSESCLQNLMAKICLIYLATVELVLRKHKENMLFIYFFLKVGVEEYPAQNFQREGLTKSY